MNVLNGLIPLWLNQTVVCNSVSKLLCEGWGFLTYAHLASGTEDLGEVSIYDGVDSNGVKLLDLSAAATYNDQASPSLPIPFNRGLYVTSTNNPKSYTIVFIGLRN